jgi:hypothetical protein
MRYKHIAYKIFYPEIALQGGGVTFAI